MAKASHVSDPDGGVKVKLIPELTVSAVKLTVADDPVPDEIDTGVPFEIAVEDAAVPRLKRAIGIVHIKLFAGVVLSIAERRISKLYTVFAGMLNIGLN